MLARIEHCVVLDAGSNDVVAWTGQSGDCQIVTLGAAAGKNNFSSAAIQQQGYRVSRTLDGCPRLLPVMVDRRSVAKVLAKIRPHGVEHLRRHRSGGVVVEVNAGHHANILQAFVRRTPETISVYPLLRNGLDNPVLDTQRADGSNGYRQVVR